MSREKINYDLYYEIYEKRKKLGMIKFDNFKNRTYEKLPKHKYFDFIRKAFKESPWNNIKKFKIKNENDTIYIVDTIYWEYLLDGYVLKLLFYNTNNSQISRVRTIKNINCNEISSSILEIKDVEIVLR